MATEPKSMTEKETAPKAADTAAPAPAPETAKKAAPKKRGTTKTKAAPKPRAKATPKPATPTLPTTVTVAQDAVDAAVLTGRETVETVVKTSTEVAQKGVEKSVAFSQDQVDVAVKFGAEAFKSYESLIDESRTTIAAFAKANEVLTNGMQAWNQTVIAMTRKAVEDDIAALQKLANCKSPADIFVLQTEFLKGTYASSIDNSRELSALSVKVVEESAKPLAERLNQTVETITKPIAA